MNFGTQFSADRVYRYTLERDSKYSGGLGTVLFICLNPSTADETVNDPTVRRCLGYTERWGYDRLLVGNAFAYRATDPKVMRAAADPVGSDNDVWLLAMVGEAQRVVCAWGANCAHQHRENRLIELLSGFDHLYALGLTAAGFPRHPLYMRANVEPVPFLREYSET